MENVDPDKLHADLAMIRAFGVIDPNKLDALEAMARALQALNHAKKRGIDVEPYRKRVKEVRRLFRAKDYRGVIDRMEQIIVEVAGPSAPEG